MSVKEKTPVMQLAGGLAVSLVATLVLVFAFAVLVMLLDIGGEVITPVNQVIKVLSILSGTMVAARKMKGWLAGLAVGAVYMLLGVLLYCAFSGELLPAAAVLGDAALGCAAGLLSGMLAGTLKR